MACSLFYFLNFACFCLAFPSFVQANEFTRHLDHAEEVPKAPNISKNVEESILDENTEIPISSGFVFTTASTSGKVEAVSEAELKGMEESNEIPDSGDQILKFLKQNTTEESLYRDYTQSEVLESSHREELTTEVESNTAIGDDDDELDNEIGDVSPSLSNKHYQNKNELEELEGSDPKLHRSPSDKEPKIKHNSRKGSTRSNITMFLDIHGHSLKIHLHKINPYAFLPNAFVKLMEDGQSKSENVFKIANKRDVKMYEGSLERDKRSYVCGSIVDGTFKGIVLLSNGTVMYIEPVNPNDKNENFLVYREEDIRYQNCPESGNPTKMCQLVTSLLKSYFCKREGKHRLLCFYGEKGKPNAPPSDDSDSKKNYRPKSVSEVFCSVRMISDASHFVDAHNKNVLSVVRELLTVFLHANHVLRHLDLNEDGEPENLHLRLNSIIIYDTDSNPNLWDGKGSMVRKQNELSMKPQGSCMTLMFVSKLLPEEPVSVANDGGVCLNNKLGQNAAQNTAVINTMTPHGHSLYPSSWTTLMTIGQIMGTYKTDCASDPTPSSHDNWRNFFSICRSINMAHTLLLRGYCLQLGQRNPNPLIEGRSLRQCGNGIVETLEECDCGNILECAMKEHCCIPPGQLNECMLDRSKKYECDSLNRCCDTECKLVPESEQKFCGPGDPVCISKSAYCNGRSQYCPVSDDVASVYNGRPCGLGETGTCNDGFCYKSMSSVCFKLGLLDCKCNASSGFECHLCCRNEVNGSLCTSATELGVKLGQPQLQLMYRSGQQCGEDEEGVCDENGECYLEAANDANNLHYSGVLNSSVFEFGFVLFTIFWRRVMF